MSGKSNFSIMLQFNNKHLLRTHRVHSIWDTKAEKTFFRRLGGDAARPEGGGDRKKEKWIPGLSGRVSDGPGDPTKLSERRNNMVSTATPTFLKPRLDG